MAYIGPAPNPGQNREVDDISSGFNGGTASFTLQVNVKMFLQEVRMQ